MLLSHRRCGLAILAVRLFCLAVTLCLMLAPLSTACCAGILCDARQHPLDAEKHCHETMGTPSSPLSVAARATPGCESMNSALEAIREEFRLSPSNEVRPDSPFSSLSARDGTLPQLASESQCLRQDSFAPFLDPLCCSVFPLRS